MKRTSHLMRNNLFIQFLIFYLAILLIPVIICGSIYMKSYDLIKSEIDNLNESIINRVQDSFNSQIEGLENIANLINFNPNISSLVYRTVLNTSDRMLLYKLLGDIKNIVVTNNEINDLFIYFRKSDCVITPICTYTGCAFFGLDRDALWDHPIESGYLISMSDKKPYALIDQKQKNTTAVYFRSLPLSDIRGSLAYIGIYLDSDKIYRDMRTDIDADHGDFYIVDRNGNALFSGSGSPQYDLLSMIENTVDNHTTQQISFQRNNYVVYQTVSEQNGLRFISITPSNIYNRRTNSIRWLYLLSLLLCIFVGAALAVYFSRKNYNPIRDIIEKFQFSSTNTKTNQNELELIKSSINDIVREYDITKIEIDEQKNTLKNTFLLSLIKDTRLTDERVKEGLNYFNLDITKKYYTIMIFCIMDCNGTFDDIPLERSEEYNDFIHRISVSEISTHLNEEGKSISIDNSGEIVFLYNFDPLFETSYLKKSISDILTMLKQEYDVVITVAVSSMHDKLIDLNLAYREAINAKEYKLLADSESVIFFDDIKSSYDKQFSRRYPQSEIHQMVNNLCIGDVEAARNILHQIFEQDFFSSESSIQVIKCRMFSLIDSMMTAVNNISSTEHDVVIHLDQHIESMLNSQSINELKRTIELLFDHIEDIYLQKMNEKDEYLRNNIIAFINDHYFEYNLNVTTVADHFNMSVDGLSRFFKKHMNTNLLSYINEKRIEYAEHMLENPDISIKSIAKQAGFSNSDSYIRVHKKIRGITPGKSRLMLMRQSVNNDDNKK